MEEIYESEQKQKNLLFEFSVPFNDEIVVAERKTSKIILGCSLLLGALIMLLFGFLIYVIGDKDLTLIIIFVVIAIAFCFSSLFFFLKTKPNIKNDNKSLVYQFYQFHLEIIVDNSQYDNMSNKVLKKILYRPYNNKQFIAKIIDSEDKFLLIIYIGSFNNVPRYKKYVIPKRAISIEELDKFQEVLKQILKNDYVKKLKKKN